MPVEIKQLIIRAAVEEKPTDGTQNEGAMSPNQDEVVAACVKEVMRILKKAKNR